MHFRNGLTTNRPVKFLDTKKKKSLSLFLAVAQATNCPKGQLLFPVSERFLGAEARLYIPSPPKQDQPEHKTQALSHH